MKRIVQIRILRFFLLSKASLPYNRILTSLSWLSDGRDLSMLIKSFIRICRISLKIWHRRKKCNVVSSSMLQQHNGFKVPSKLCRNLCSRKWLSPNFNLVSNFIPTWSWMLKILLSLGLIKFSRGLRKRSQDRQLRLSGSSLFHSFMIQCKIRVLKITGPIIERSKCIWLSCGGSHGWIKAMDIFRDFAMKNLMK